MFGFTGTPIFAENSSANVHGKRTTKDLFNECLHKYVITDAIRDENVLKFSVEYIRTVRQRDGVRDIEVEAIDTAEVMEADERLENITDYIIVNHNRKTHAPEFTALFCVANIKTLIKYYDLFRQKKDAEEHKLKIGTIFSYQANEEDSDADGFIQDEMPTDEISDGRAFFITRTHIPVKSWITVLMTITRCLVRISQPKIFMGTTRILASESNNAT